MAHSSMVPELRAAARRRFASIVLMWMCCACGDDLPIVDLDSSTVPIVDPCEHVSANSPPEILNNTRLTEDETREFFHLSQGSELFPVDWLLALRTESGEPFFDPQQPGFGLLRDAADPIWNKAGLPVGMSSSPTQGEGLEAVEMFGFNCAACHVGEVRAENKVYRIIGAPSRFDINSFLNSFNQALHQTIVSPPRVNQFIAQLKSMNSQMLEESSGAPTTLEQLDGQAKMVEAFVGRFREPWRNYLRPRLSARRQPAITFAGAGRVDAFGAAHNLLFPEEPWDLNAPVDYPRLWNLSLMERYHWDGNTSSTLQRNVGQALGLGAGFNRETLATTARFDNLLRLEALTRKIDPPRWPFELPDAALVGRGFEVYRTECARCHSQDSGYSDPDVGTDPNRARNFAGTTKNGPFYAVLEKTLAGIIEKAGAQSGGQKYAPETEAWNAPGTYQTRTLAGVWATAPYLHNGSVPSLAALLDLTARPARFALGGQQLDLQNVGYCSPTGASEYMVRDTSLPGNGNAGHEYGRELRARDKRALIAYLRTL